MKKAFLIFLVMFTVVAQSFATTYVPVTKEQAIKMGYTKEVKLQNEAEKLIGTILYKLKFNEK